MSIRDNIRTATAGIPPANYGSNANRQDGLQHQYFRDRSKEFFKQKISLTSALFAGEMQGVDYNNFYAWTPVKIRASAVIDPTTGDHLSDDWQEIIIENTNIDSVPLGAYVKFNDNIWIVINPKDVGSVTGNAIVRRCNCTYNTLDYYGNVVQTPMSYAKGMALASANNITEYITLPGTYQHIAMQLNEATRNVHNNTRLILGGEAYFLTGVTNFIRDFTLDPTSAHLIKAECRLGEANVYDDLVNEVANDRAFSWVITLTASEKMPINGTQTITALSTRNGAVPDGEVNPYNYLWESSDYSIVTVTDDGVCEAVGEGTATITCFLQENTNISTSIEITVSESVSGQSVEFITDLPYSLEAYSNVSCETAYFVDGLKQEDQITYTFSGADEDCYSTSVDGNVLTITAYAPSNKPLIVTASCGGVSTSQTMYLVGF